MGRDDSMSVQDANTMVARVMVLLLLAAAKGCWWLLEQPSSSLMEWHPTFQKTLAILGNVRKLPICLGEFGHKTKKATILYSRSLMLYSSHLLRKYVEFFCGFVRLSFGAALWLKQWDSLCKKCLMRSSGHRRPTWWSATLCSRWVFGNGGQVHRCSRKQTMYWGKGSQKQSTLPTPVSWIEFWKDVSVYISLVRT